MSMKRKKLLTLCACAALAGACEADDILRYVLPEVGTVNSFEVSNGNLYPLVGRPWGMHSWSPVTKMDEKGTERWFYDYTHVRFHGLKLTHQLSPWIGDYATATLLPMTGKPAARRTERFSWYSHKTETISPTLYRVYLPDFDVTFRLAPTARAAAAAPPVRYRP